MRTIKDLAGILSRYAITDGIFQTPVPRLTVVRYSTPTVPELSLYEPALCVVAQGAKESRLDPHTYRYDAANYLIGSVHLPVFGAVVEANVSVPFLCIRMEFDILIVAELLQKITHHIEPKTALKGLELGKMDETLVDTVTRYAELIHNKNEALVIAPLVERELIWRLLQDNQSSAMLRQMLRGGKLHGLAKSIEWLRDNYVEPIRVEDLASIAGMSLSSFHEQFKTITGTSPLRFRSRLRLMEARRLMLVEGHKAAEAGHMVGYQEPAQFSREYVKLFGLPPKADIDRLILQKLK